MKVTKILACEAHALNTAVDVLIASGEFQKPLQFLRDIETIQQLPTLAQMFLITCIFCGDSNPGDAIKVEVQMTAPEDREIKIDYVRLFADYHVQRWELDQNGVPFRVK